MGASCGMRAMGASCGVRAMGASDFRGGDKNQNPKKTKLLYEENRERPTVAALYGLPLVGTADSKSNQKGVRAAGRFAPASRLILG